MILHERVQVGVMHFRSDCGPNTSFAQSISLLILDFMTA